MDSVERWNKSLETLGLAGDLRVTGDEKLASSERMEMKKDKSRGCVERKNKPRCK